ncbi:hypothetical protein Zmor_007601 [Zophobas morio]|uniref:Odorant receptor n=1 Tax=Zophobas morio TaxID=2755281 RepID=A0AA38IUD6_9CUCU|nr:hypothetical protein Zmor_007601 [Zophobas morio]
MRFDWISPIRINLKMLRIIGLWPDGEKYKLELYTLYSMVIVGTSLFLHTLFYTVEVVLLLKSEMEIVIKTLFMALNQSIAFLKCCCFMYNLKRMKRLIQNLENDLFQPQSDKQRKQIKPMIVTWKIGQLSFFAIAYITLLLFLLLPILTKTTNQYRLPFHAWYPWSIKKSPFYEITYLFQSFAFTLRVTCSTTMDTLVAALNTYISAQCTILCDTFRSISPEENIYQNIKRCVLHHKEILRLAKDSNAFYNWIALGQFFTTCITLALTMFLLSLMDPFSSEGQTLLLYLCVVSSETFLYCWFGNEVEIKVRVKMLFCCYLLQK